MSLLIISNFEYRCVQNVFISWKINSSASMNSDNSLSSRHQQCSSVSCSLCILNFFHLRRYFFWRFQFKYIIITSLFSCRNEGVIVHYLELNSFKCVPRPIYIIIYSLNILTSQNISKYQMEFIYSQSRNFLSLFLFFTHFFFTNSKLD